MDTVRGVEFWDDAHSPTPESAIASMRTLSESGRHIGTMLLGGLDRGYDYRALGEAVRDLGVRRCVLFPDAGTAIKKHLPEDVETLETRSMEEAVRWAAETNSGACLLSAAAPSYSIWRNFEEK
ncbi:MAG TPA: hypothetical protein PK765_03205 [bacterium]|nr:hypothetical protein [bacterium]